jgi:phasin
MLAPSRKQIEGRRIKSGKRYRQIRAFFRPEQESTMATNDRFELPAEVRALAERSVQQARQAFEGFVTAAQQAVFAFEGQAETARKGAKDVTDKAMSFAQQNMASSFELAQQLVRARDVQEVLRLQNEYIRRQMQVLGEQARTLGDSATHAARDAMTPRP